MYRTMLRATIPRATVTHADQDVARSLTVDQDLMDAADLLSGEQVAVVDVTNGTRLETYVVPGARGSGVLGVNGAAAHPIRPGDVVAVLAYAAMGDSKARSHQPKVVLVDAGNRLVDHLVDHLADDLVDPADELALDRTEPAETADAARLDELIQANDHPDR